MVKPPRLQPEIVIAGGGVIGLTLALELYTRGADVAVLETRAAMRQASYFAAGMLAAHDPHNPPQLRSLAELSLELYPRFLHRVESLGGLAVPFQTDTTFQYLTDGTQLKLAERSIDPRQMADALLAAVRATDIALYEDVGDIAFVESSGCRAIHTFSGLKLQPRCVIHANGAWFDSPSVAPRKGQMLRVHLPASLSELREVHRSGDIYIVPRTQGPQAGTALIGATVEDAGFDLTLHRKDLLHLHELAAGLLPALASVDNAPEVEAWAGLRPATPDGLPLLGLAPDLHNEYVATGHFRNGILLAPATALVMADFVEGLPAKVDLSAFRADRFRTG